MQTEQQHDGQGKGKDKTVAIIVDGTPHEVPKKEKISYDEVVELAYPDHHQHPDVTYAVTWTRGPKNRPEGTLPPGGEVKVVEGMAFNVSRAGQS